VVRNFISQDEIEAITESVLSKNEISTDWGGKVERIDIDYLIEFAYGLDIAWENIDNLSQGGVILAAINPKRKIIYMNESKRDLFVKKLGTMNFSKAHELGHWILHVTDQKEYEQLSFTDQERFICRGGASRPPEEFQADMFAASLLMPKEIISGAINEMKYFGEVRFSDLYRLKDEFEVSISALVNRIRTLNLLFIKDKVIYFSEEEATGQMRLF
jgi:Zn-dependent peptidase ImmA (M78 family)